jgi:hypothetical protein
MQCRATVLRGRRVVTQCDPCLLHDTDGVRASEREHMVENVDSDGDFGALPGIRLRRPQSQRLEAKAPRASEAVGC